MSVNRSVQAAQRRRAGPSDQGIPGRTHPQPSINSAQMFANQARSGPGPNIPNGRLAGQQEAMQQTQMQKQMAQQMSQGSNDKLSSVNKMTIAQAITLITVRLGIIETKLMQMPESSSINIGGDTGVDTTVLQSIMTRLESLEKRSVSTNGAASTPELNLIKQQLETLKQVVVQTKSSTSNLVKENILLKTQIEDLKKDLSESKELLVSLEKLTFENNQCILNLTMNSTDDYNSELNEQNMVNLDELQNSELKIDELQDDLSYDHGQNEIIGTDLKKLIESELSLDM
jgi:hypothetical protein